MEEEEGMFNKIKDLITNESMLAHPELNKPFELEVDALGYVIGAVLIQ